ncbi:MAG: hypothetical protein CVT92_02660 [Bacteroidetes bacterium HGW-Bacteroidetes-1]|jgi:hypothetical protein|nr:MAG: hypothetical protein CVT92_02660 [Bacteroidetes bacterium HGW-Bacteroidetes-1]
MFDSWFKKPEPKPCSHPKWEIIKEIETPSIVEQMKLETLTPEAKEKILQTLQPCDYNKQSLLVMSCPFCGTVKEFKTQTNYSEGRICNHQWNTNDVVKKSKFDETCGEDATFEQRMKVASVMQPADFRSEVFRTFTCKLCGKIETKTLDEGITSGSSERCAHDWKVIADGGVHDIVNTYSNDLGECKEIRVNQKVLLSCVICGKIKNEELKSTLVLKPADKKKK